jgi:surface protein
MQTFEYFQSRQADPRISMCRFHPHGSTINFWDVSQVTDMSNAFRYISEDFDELNDPELDDPLMQTFNEDLNCWDTSSVTSMKRMFMNASSFNGKIGDWDVSKVTDMAWMFASSSAFNGDISSWEVGNVEDMFCQKL